MTVGAETEIKGNITKSESKRSNEEMEEVQAELAKIEKDTNESKALELFSSNGTEVRAKTEADESILSSETEKPRAEMESIPKAGDASSVSNGEKEKKKKKRKNKKNNNKGIDGLGQPTDANLEFSNLAVQVPKENIIHMENEIERNMDRSKETEIVSEKQDQGMAAEKRKPNPGDKTLSNKKKKEKKKEKKKKSKMNGATVIPQQAPKIVGGFKQLGPSCRIATPNGAEKDLFKAASGIFSDVPNQKQFAGIKGMENLDNTCFMNSVLQCMTHCEPLLRKIEAMNHPKCKSGTICYICGLKELLNDIMRGEKAILSPQKFATDLTNVMTNFTLGQQADVQEHLCNFIQRLGGPAGVFFSLMTTKLRCGRCGARGVRGGSVSPLADLGVDVSSAATLDSQFAPETSHCE